MKITKRQLRRIIKEEKARIQEAVPGPDAGRIKAARASLESALKIFEDMGYDEASDYVIAAIEATYTPGEVY